MHNTPLKQQLSQTEDDYEILSLEICNYKIIVVLSLTQHVSKTTVEQNEDDYEILSLEIYNYKLVVVLSLAQHVSRTTVEQNEDNYEIGVTDFKPRKNLGIIRLVLVLKSKLGSPLFENMILSHASHITQVHHDLAIKLVSFMQLIALGLGSVKLHFEL